MRTDCKHPCFSHTADQRFPPAGVSPDIPMASSHSINRRGRKRGHAAHETVRFVVDLSVLFATNAHAEFKLNKSGPFCRAERVSAGSLDRVGPMIGHECLVDRRKSRLEHRRNCHEQPTLSPEI